MRLFFSLLLFLIVSSVNANPYWDPDKVPKDNNYTDLKQQQIHLKTIKNLSGSLVLRIQVDWLEYGENYTLSSMIVETSGTPALLARSKHKPKWGSYLGVLKNSSTGEAIYYDSIGTGKEYRKLARAINLRFPAPTADVIFELYAENPQTGLMDKVVEQNIAVQDLRKESRVFNELEVKELQLATTSPSLKVNIYAEGYSSSEKNKFWQQAMRVVESLNREHFPGLEHMSIYAVFSPSVKKLGPAKNLGIPVPEFDSFLGLYYPYWDDFGRWYHIVYPTRENKFRQGLAAAPYDYPIILVNDSGYWGVGNYMSHTAIPAGNSTYFTYLLIHELGHFFGLNEEYEGGGRTELEFAPDMDEPWSQNITFLAQPVYSALKWNQFVNPETKIPTPHNEWDSTPAIYGAYHGGYADSVTTKGVSHKPGLNCVMESHDSFCDICTKGILDVVRYSLGMNK